MTSKYTFLTDNYLNRLHISIYKNSIFAGIYVTKQKNVSKLQYALGYDMISKFVIVNTSIRLYHIINTEVSVISCLEHDFKAISFAIFIG